VVPVFVLAGLMATDTVPTPPPASPRSAAARLFDELGSHDRVAVGCVGASSVPVNDLLDAVKGSTVRAGAGPLPETFARAAADRDGRSDDGLVWMRLGDDPMVGAQTLGSPPPLALADRWTAHWTESPRIRATRDHTVWIAPHGRTPAPDQSLPEASLVADPLPEGGCAVWSRLPDHQARNVERLVTLDQDRATLRVFAASARASDGAERVAVAGVAPSTKRRPEAVMVVYAAPHVVAGAPWLQQSELPGRLGGLSTLIPSGYAPAPGQVRAWFDDVLGAAMAVVVPVVDDAGRPARVPDLLADVRDRYGLPGEVEPEGRGGRLASVGGVAIGALPGALVLSTDPEILTDMLTSTGTQWARPPGRDGAVAAWWLASDDHGPAVGATLTIEDRMWRVDAAGGLAALQRSTRWAGL